MSTSLWTTWEQTVAQAPATPALWDAQDGTVYTRVALSERVESLVPGLPGTVSPGQIVAFNLRNGADWLAYFLLLQRTGLVALPLDSSLPEPSAARVAAEMGAHWWLDTAFQWQRLSSASALLLGDYCLLKTTSGSTGQPRGLAFTSAQMLVDGRQVAATMGIGPNDLNFGGIPFGHSYGLGNLILPLILQGTPLVSSTEILPDPLAEQINRYGATVLPSVPAVLRALAESTGDPARLRSLRRVISAGAPLRPEVARSFHAKFGLPIQNFYGSSETGGICFDRTGEATLTGRSLGPPLEGVSVRLDAEGRVIVRSAAVVDPGEHALADLGAWTAEGELVLTGRASPLANIGGKKVSPLHVEQALRSLEGVSDAWVGVQTRATGESDFLLAAVETERSSTDLRHDLAERLPLWQIPRRLWTASRLPRTARGKLDRQELEARCLGLDTSRI